MPLSKGIRLALILSFVFGVIGIMFGGLGNGYTPRTIIVYGLMGAFLGAVGAPEIEPKYFRYPTVWQVFFSTIGSLLFAYGIQLSLEGYIIAVLAGVLLGFTARFWIKHVVFP